MEKRVPVYLIPSDSPASVAAEVERERRFSGEDPEQHGPVPHGQYHG